ncbi:MULTISPECIES: homocysteine S-methyltransferase family protein [Marinobacter]|uniref:Homocysteine S-methyltransferase family protein n=1 Tax=Marinobacter suaedae TaxID=3057675 RepID=A0ABT8VX72_9GAMM|nr:MULTISPECIES: homocysteine S-methyltransferase family protein [unclassified Marinobacter]MBZ2168698.1 homocysteine S-methyltransferase family protein [Marinobacter sp. F4216]MDO3720576.1 homocysteine S-methyltransferase family protein [Marinobacter sp. chi1]
MTAHNRQIVLLDGGMGQEFVRRSRHPVSPLWSAQVMLDEPDLVQTVHREFIEAGARVITLNSYSATPQRLTRDGESGWFEPLQAAALIAAARAREESGKDVRIAGCLPPLVASYHYELVPDDATCLRDYRRIVAAQAKGVDCFICETLSLAREARMATVAAAESNLPVWTAFTVDDEDGSRLRSGESLVEAAREVAAVGAERVLVNCSAPEAVTTAMAELAGLGIPFGGYANGFESAPKLQAGGTVDILTARSDLGPDAYAEHALRWVEQGATLVGGCCEVSPAHIEALANRLTSAGYRLVSS